MSRSHVAVALLSFVASLGAQVFVPRLATAAAPTTSDTIRARRIEIVDETGRPRAVLSVAKGGAFLELSDETGRHRVGVDEAGMSMNDVAGVTRLSLGVDTAGARLALADAAGQPRAAITVEPEDGGAGLVLNDAVGKPQAFFVVKSAGKLLHFP